VAARVGRQAGAGGLAAVLLLLASDRTADHYDLSCQLVTDGFRTWRHLSWTALSAVWGEHSGDIVDAPAPHGATECINVRLARVPAGAVLIPQLYLYNGYRGGDGGESFDELEENLFGYMTRSDEQRGLPVEPRTVRAKTMLCGADRVTLPVMFWRAEDGAFYAKWAHLGIRGRAGFFGGYQAEHNRVSTGLLARAILERQYLQVRYLAGLLGGKAESVTAAAGGAPAAAARDLAMLEAGPAGRTVTDRELAGARGGRPG
jgi:hypothetical protein